MKLLIRLVSDVHLEGKRKNFTINRFNHVDDDTITCLILAGDIGHPAMPHYEDFLARCKTNFDHVLVIAGNHEYYRQKGKFWSKRQIDEIITTVCNKTGCVFLNHDIYKIGNIRFLGCTLWSHIPKSHQDECKTDNDFNNIQLIESNEEVLMPVNLSDDDESKEEADNATNQTIFEPNPTNNPNAKKKRKRKNGQKKKVSKNAIDIDDYNFLHDMSVSWLKEQIKLTPSKEKVIIVTHHAPSIKMIDKKYHNDPLSHCYYSDLESLCKRPVIAWFSGHTHGSTSHYIGSVKSCSNCVGYKHEKNSRYNPNFTYIVDVNNSLSCHYR